MALRDDLLVLAPELSSETTFRIDQFITWAALRVNRRIYGEAKADLVTILLAAHMLTRFSADNGPSEAGQVIQEKVGDLMQAYSKLEMPGSEELATTSYGAQYAQIKRSVLTTPLVV